MLTINVILQDGAKRINGTLSGKKFNVLFSDETYAALMGKQKALEAINEVELYDTWVQEVEKIIEGVSEGDLIESACPDLMLDTDKGFYYIKVDKEVSAIAVPQPLVTVILESVDKGIDPTPIVKAWIRFLRNPNFTEAKAIKFADYITSTIIDSEEVERLVEEEGYSFEKANLMATYNDVSISNEGLIVGKKYARLLTEGWEIDPETNKAVKKPLFVTTKTVDKFSGDVTETTDYPEFAEELTFEPPVMGRKGNAFTCGSKEKEHIIKVGEVHSLESWDQVDTNDNRSCCPGLHIGRVTAA